jgi:hypothetical protein
MSCELVRSLLPLRTLDVLEEDEEKLVCEHVEACALCRRESVQLDEAVELVREPRPARGGNKQVIWEKVRRELDERTSEVPAAGGLQLSIALFCSFCHDAVARAEACYCASCLAPHHEECFRTHGRCSALGCEETQTVRPRIEEPSPVAAPRRFARYGLGAALVALGGLGGAVAARRPMPAPESQGIPVEVGVGDKTPVSVTPSEKMPTPEELSTEDAIRRFLDAPKKPGASPESIDVNVEDADIAEVMSAISARVGKPIFVEPDVKEKITISLRKMAWRDAVEVMAKMCKCEVAPLGSESLILQKTPKVTIQFSAANVNTVIQLLAAYSGKSLLVSPGCPSVALTVDLHEVDWGKALASILRTYDVHAELIGHVIVVLPGAGPVPDLSSFERVQWTFPTVEGDGNAAIDMTVADADLRDVCDELGRRVGRNIIVDPDVKEKVTISLQQVGWHDALLAIAHLTRCDLEERRGIFVLSQAPMVTLQATDAPAVQWFQLLAAYSGKNILAPDVTGTITGDFHGVRWLDILYGTARAYGYEVNEDAGEIIRVSMPRSTRPAQPQPPRPRFEGPLEVESVKKHLVVTAIAVDPRPGSHNRAIIEFDGVSRIYEENDVVRDRSDRRTDGLTIVKIVEGSVQLKLGEEELTVELKTP